MTVNRKVHNTASYTTPLPSQIPPIKTSLWVQPAFGLSQPLGLAKWREEG